MTSKKSFTTSTLSITIALGVSVLFLAYSLYSQINGDEDRKLLNQNIKVMKEFSNKLNLKNANAYSLEFDKSNFVNDNKIGHNCQENGFCTSQIVYSDLIAKPNTADDLESNKRLEDIARPICEDIVYNSNKIYPDADINKDLNYVILGRTEKATDLSELVEKCYSGITSNGVRKVSKLFVLEKIVKYKSLLRGYEKNIHFTIYNADLSINNPEIYLSIYTE
jgi:hypothetical protein